MLARFPRLSKLAIKILEITGAACASTFAAVLLGNSREPPRPPAPPVVQLAPADAQMIRTVREESVALAEQLRSASDTRSTAPAAAATAAAPAETGLPATPASVPSRLWPAAASSPPNAPRPPLGVGEYLSSSM